MFDIEYPKPAEKVILTSFYMSREEKELFDEDLAEMVMLCRTAGAEVVDIIVQNGSAPKAATYMGTGKLREISQRMKEEDCKTIVIDAELSPAQIRNIEKIVSGKVLDRNQLILDIFALHAKTNESRIQVELAQMNILYPRLTGAWTHFSKQVGGIGTRGPGETQLEVDRRLVQKKISDLKKRLLKIEKSRITQRSRRAGIYKAALVGYTNVGKSTILNAISGSDVLVENKLFATLDTATRKVFIPAIGDIIVSDTVGFLRKLPHQLVASFRSTLEVVNEADILLIVMDASSKWTKHQFETVNEVLDELKVEQKKRLIVFNKSDLVDDPFLEKNIALEYEQALLMSAFKKEDQILLKEKIGEIVSDITLEREMEQIIQQQSKKVY